MSASARRLGLNRQGAKAAKTGERVGWPPTREACGGRLASAGFGIPGRVAWLGALGVFALGLLAIPRVGRADPPIEVHVAGERHGPPASSRDPTAASTVIRRQQLSEPGASAARVVARVPGVQVAESGAESELATASVRGASSAELPVYLAGIRLNDDVTGTADLSMVPLWMLDRAEVFRGNAPEAIDRLGIAGAIVLEPRLPRTTELRAGAGAGSFGEWSLWGGGAVAAPGASSLVALRRSGARNDYTYTDDNGTRFDASDDREVRRDNADFASTDAWAIGRAELGPGAQVTTIVNALSREQGVTGLGVVPARAARARVERLLGGISARVPCPGRRSPGAPVDQCQLELSSAALTARSVIDDPLFELGLLTSRATSAGDRFTQSVRVVDHPDDAVRVSAGVTQELERLAIDRAAAPGLRARRDVTRASASVRVDASRRVQLIALGALACHTTAAGDAGKRCGVLAPAGRAGVRVRAAEWLDLLGNVGRYVRVPALGELYGVSPLVRGNAALAPESGVTADAGFRAATTDPSSTGAWVDAFGFVRGVTDLVAYRRSGLGYVRPYNTGRARVLGAEIAAGADAFQHLRADVAVTLLDPRDTTPGRTLGNDLVPYQSRFVANAGVELYARHRASLELRVSHRSSRVADPAGLVVIGAQTLLDVGATLWFWRDRVALRGAVQDVTDAARSDVVGYPLPGRSVHGSAELVW